LLSKSNKNICYAAYLLFPTLGLLACRATHLPTGRRVGIYGRSDATKLPGGATITRTTPLRRVCKAQEILLPHRSRGVLGDSARNGICGSLGFGPRVALAVAYIRVYDLGYDTRGRQAHIKILGNLRSYGLSCVDPDGHLSIAVAVEVAAADFGPRTPVIPCAVNIIL